MVAVSFLTPAQLVGYLALVLGVSAFLQKSDTRLKVVRALADLPRTGSEPHSILPPTSWRRYPP